jgi:Zn-dependent peptidase ImmA (M78 family)
LRLQPKATRRSSAFYLVSTRRILYGAFEQEDVEHAGYEALRVSVMATKSKHIRNLTGYYNGTLDRMLDRLVNEESERVLAEI